MAANRGKLKKICAITERRADYSRLKPIFHKIQDHPQLELFIIVSGSHLLAQQGKTIEIIKRDGFKIAKQAPMFSQDEPDTGATMARGLARAVLAVTDALEEIKPDIMLVGFDLGAHLAAAISASHMNILTAHIQGGERTGTIDESIRHAISKFAHIHFPSSDLSCQRLIKMGENPDYVFKTGCPSIDVIKQTKLISGQELAKQFDINLNKPLILLIQHPVTTEAKDSQSQILKTLSAVRQANQQTILIYPNTDAGSKSIIQAIERTKIKQYKNLAFETFLSLMSIANVIIGNSSAGIREAPSFKLASVNIGTRQQGREQANNVINVDYNEKEIFEALQQALFDKDFQKQLQTCNNPYGDGKASQRIVDILADIEIKPGMLQKKLYE